MRLGVHHLHGLPISYLYLPISPYFSACITSIVSLLSPLYLPYIALYLPTSPYFSACVTSMVVSRHRSRIVSTRRTVTSSGLGLGL